MFFIVVLAMYCYIFFKRCYYKNIRELTVAAPGAYSLKSMFLPLEQAPCIIVENESERSVDVIMFWRTEWQEETVLRNELKELNFAIVYHPTMA